MSHCCKEVFAIRQTLHQLLGYFVPKSFFTFEEDTLSNTDFVHLFVVDSLVSSSYSTHISAVLAHPTPSKPGRLGFRNRCISHLQRSVSILVHVFHCESVFALDGALLFTVPTVRALKLQVYRYWPLEYGYLKRLYCLKYRYRY